MTATQNEILDALQRQTGRTWTVEHTTTKSQIEKAREKLAKGDFTGMVSLVLASMWGQIPGSRSNYAEDETLANNLLGVPDGDVQRTVTRVLSD